MKIAAISHLQCFNENLNLNSHPLDSVGSLIFLSKLQLKHFIFSVEFIVEQFSQNHWKRELTLPIFRLMP